MPDADPCRALAGISGHAAADPARYGPWSPNSVGADWWSACSQHPLSPRAGRRESLDPRRRGGPGDL